MKESLKNAIKLNYMAVDNVIFFTNDNETFSLGKDKKEELKDICKEDIYIRYDSENKNAIIYKIKEKIYDSHNNLFIYCNNEDRISLN